MSKICFTILLFFSLEHIIAQGQYTLDNGSVEDFKLKNQETISLPIDNDIFLNAIEQRWYSSDNQEFYVVYYNFESELEALRGITYVANSCALPFVYGSPKGEIIGNMSWVSLDQSAICFQKGNIGVKIFKPVNFMTQDADIINYLSGKILEKIEMNSLEQIDEQISSTQLSYVDFHRIVLNLEDFFNQKGYSKNEVDYCTKWLRDKNNTVFGLREQWSNNSQSFFSIDISIFPDSVSALEAVENRSAAFLSFVFNMKDAKSLRKAINEWGNRWEVVKPMKYLSLVGRDENIVFQLYIFNNEGIKEGDLMLQIFNLLTLRKE